VKTAASLVLSGAEAIGSTVSPATASISCATTIAPGPRRGSSPPARPTLSSACAPSLASERARAYAAAALAPEQRTSIRRSAVLSSAASRSTPVTMPIFVKGGDATAYMP